MYWIVLAVCFWAGAVAAQPREFKVMDSQGFGAPMVAYTMEIPAGWKAEGQVLWRKPCSGNDLFETVLTITAPDGLSGARLMPGHQILWTQHEMAGDPQMSAMFAAQQEAERNKLRTQWQGSNCHVVPITRAEQIFETLIRAKRPADAQVVEQKPQAAVLETYKQMFSGEVPGSRTFFDAQTYALKYRLGGQAITEKVNLSWVMFQTELRDPGFSMFTQHTVVDALRIEWVLDARAQVDQPLLDAIGASMKINPEWQAKVQEAQRKLAEERKRNTEKNAQDRERRRKDHERRNDQQHRQFLQSIWQ